METCLAPRLEDRPPSSLLWRRWPNAVGAVYAAVVSIALVTALAVWARLPFASYLEMVSLGGLAVAVLLSIVGQVLERLKLVPKTKTQGGLTDELEGSPPLAEPIPIVEAAAPHDRPKESDEPEGGQPSQATPSIPLEDRTIPRAFLRPGVKADWTLEPSREDPSEKSDG
jgi:hypothetical protein